MTPLKPSQLYSVRVDYDVGYRLSIPAERVLALEQTRGNFLDYGAPTQQSFTDELREIIGAAGEVGATLESSVTIARRR
jgi:hypothetical protein